MDNVHDEQAPEQAQVRPDAEKPSPPPKPVLRPRLRIWPVVMLLMCLWALRIVPGFFESMSMPLMMAKFMGPPACVGLILVWWLFFSRASWTEKGLGLLALIVVAAVTNMLADKSIRGLAIIVSAAPWGITGFGVALVCGSQMRSSRRTWIALSAALICFGYWDLVRTDEIRGDFQTSLSWRWEQTAEERFLEDLAARGSEAPAELASEPLAEPEWPEFRGPERNGVQPGIVLSEDWDAQAPKELWRIPVGPGWSSFSVAGNRLFTQEQRGDHEVVVCYDARSGDQVWVHKDESRFWEVVGGAGPRATPTIAGSGLYTLGASGLLNRLSPLNGELVWQRDLRKDANRSPPTWGFSSSPLAIHGLIIVHAGGSGDKGLLAYDEATGDLRWSAPAGNDSYSSPQSSTVDGKTCVLMLTNDGLGFVDAENGGVIGNHVSEFQGNRIIQPLAFDDSSILLGTPMTGTQRVDAQWDGKRFTTETRWTTNRMKPNFNDFVVHNGFLYGFDSNIFACVDVRDGKRIWKRGRYGNGQVILLSSGDQLLVISEDGELVLLRATPTKLTELAKHRVLDGRTWNHPVLIGDRLYVRNGEEAACFQMPLASDSKQSARSAAE